MARDDFYDSPTGAAYSTYMERPRLSRAIGRLLWGGDCGRYYESMGALDAVPDGGTVVDCPCGAGPAFRALKPGRRVRYVAVDRSPSMLRRARKRAARRGLVEIEAVEGDATALPLPDGCADLFFSFWGLHCFDDPPAALREAARVLKPGGRLVGASFVAGSESRRQRLIRPGVGEFGPVGTQEEVEAWLADAGLAVVRLERSGPMAFFEAHRAGAGLPASSTSDPAALAFELLAEARRAQAGGGLSRLEELVARLEGVDPAAIGTDRERLAFWIDLYNALLLHRLRRRPVRGSIALKPRLFSTTAYDVGGERYSLDAIEHGVLRRNRRPPYRPRPPLRSGDPRLQAMPSRLDPRIHFALNCGARSCPPIVAYEPADLDAQLERATRSYLRAETAVDAARRRVTLPRLMRLYRADFGDRDAQLDLAARHVPALADLRAGGDGRLRVRYGRFDWTAVPGPPAT